MPSGAKVSKLKLRKPETPWNNMKKHELYKVLRDLEQKIEKRKQSLERAQAEKDRLLWFMLSKLEDDS
jgi:hypothetical protein